ncbi:MAG: cell wall metabolism sensor histidine kinase WalK [Lachnospiraceae bacterium]|nr:cell wall metabolism sensor histidine kinase WalK [Lachnospiraceae bacterium]
MNIFRSHNILKSFKLRIFLIIFVTGLFSAEMIRASIVYSYTDRALKERAMEVTEHMTIMANRLISYHYLEDGASDVISAQLSIYSTLFDGRVMVIDDNFRVIEDTYALSIGKTMIGEKVIRCFLGETISNIHAGADHVEVAVPVAKTGEDGEVTVDGVLLAGASTSSIERSREELSRRAAIIEIVYLILLLGVDALLSYVLVGPFNRISKAIGSMVSFEDETPVVSDYKETEEIAEAFRKLWQRMKVLDDSRKEFVSNVSHELKTPITSVKVLADSLNMQEDVPVEVYREFMQDITAEIDRENKIIEDLLELVRMERGASGMHVENMEINPLLEQIVKRLAPLARSEEVDLILESKRRVSADIDEVKFTQAITNIIENGIKYNKHPGWVKIQLDADHKQMEIVISDSGMGIPEGELDHIFERFYRVDKSHSREINGTGLGLAITKKTILLHKGTIEAKSTVGEGTEFRVTMPLSFIRENTGETV